MGQQEIMPEDQARDLMTQSIPPLIAGKECNMQNSRAIDTAIEFIEKINRRDFQGLHALMTADFLSIDDSGETRGSLTAAKGIEQYTKDWPDFQIYISDVYVNGDTISIVGRTTGSCDEERRGIEIRGRRLYQVAVEDSLAKSFRFAVPDSEASRIELGIVNAKKITK